LLQALALGDDLGSVEAIADSTTSFATMPMLTPRYAAYQPAERHLPRFRVMDWSFY